jgi:hypothetical protein
MSKNKKLQKALAGRSSIGQKAMDKIKADLGIKGGVKAAAKQAGVTVKSSPSSSSSSKAAPNALQQALAGRTSIGPKAIDKIKADLGIKGGIKAAAKDLGIGIKGSSSRDVFSDIPSSFSFGSSGGSTPAEFDYKSTLNLVNAQGNIDTQIARLNSEAASNVAKIKAGGDVDVARLGKESEMYQADRGLEAALGVENIRSKGAIDLQKIMNEGNERVETIRGTFGLKGKGLDRGSAILSALSSAFNF